jgi:hypothetical protein
MFAANTSIFTASAAVDVGNPYVLGVLPLVGVVLGGGIAAVMQLINSERQASRAREQYLREQRRHSYAKFLEATTVAIRRAKTFRLGVVAHAIPAQRVPVTLQDLEDAWLAMSHGADAVRLLATGSVVDLVNRVTLQVTRMLNNAMAYQDVGELTEELWDDVCEAMQADLGVASKH